MTRKQEVARVSAASEVVISMRCKSPHLNRSLSTKLCRLNSSRVVVGEARVRQVRDRRTSKTQFLWTTEMSADGDDLKVMTSPFQMCLLAAGKGKVRAVETGEVSQVERDGDPGRRGCLLVLQQSSRKNLGGHQRCPQTEGRYTRPASTSQCRLQLE